MAGELKVFDYTVNILEQLGRGAFGTVYKGFDKAKSPVAIKQVTKTDGRKASTEALKFYYLKQKVLHDHVIKVYDVKTWENSMWIVMEHCDLGDLNDYFHKYHRKLDTKKKIDIMMQISRGAAFLHLKDVVHRDIKPGNILLKSNRVNPVVKLGDFGLSKFLDPDDVTSGMSSNVGTLWFKAPEFWDRQPDERVRYHRNVDVYAAGLTFAAMLQAEPGDSLLPNAESHLLSSETNLPIGFVAFTRCQNRQSEVKVSVPHIRDPPLVKQLKYIIEEMTCFSPEARLAAAEVEGRLVTLGTSQNAQTNPSPSTSHFEEVKIFPEICCHLLNTINNVLSILHFISIKVDNYAVNHYDLAIKKSQFYHNTLSYLISAKVSFLPKILGISTLRDEMDNYDPPNSY